MRGAYSEINLCAPPLASCATPAHERNNSTYEFNIRPFFTKEYHRAKNHEANHKKSTQLKDLPKSEQKLNKKQMSKVKGGEVVVINTGPEKLVKKNTKQPAMNAQCASGVTRQRMLPEYPSIPT